MSLLAWNRSESVFDGQINDKNSKASLGMYIGFECRNR